MTIPSTTRKAGPLLGTGAQTAWPFTFKVFAESDILVTTADSLGIETVRVLDTDYTVTLNVNQDTSPGGTVTYPISGSALATGDVLTITGNLAYDQPLDLPAGGNFSPLALENELDRMAMQIQQLKEQLGRTIRVGTTSGADALLPAPASNNIIGWDSTAEALQNFPLSELATAVSFATYRYDTFTGDGTTTNFTLDADPVTLGNIDVSVDGLTSVPGVDHTILNTALIFTVAPSLGAEILARYGQGLGSGMSGDALDISYQPAGTGAGARTVQTKLRESVSVLDFYANGVNGVKVDPTGVVDSYLGIQAAITYCATYGYDLYAPGGIYRLSSGISLPLKSGFCFYGDGWSTIDGSFNTESGTRFYYYGTGTAFTITGTAIDSIDNVHLDSFSIENKSGATGSTIGLHIEYARWNKFDNLYTQGFNIGVDHNHLTWMNHFKGCVSMNNATYGINNQSDGEDSLFETCFFRYNGVANVSVNQAKNLTFTTCDFGNGPKGLVIYGANVGSSAQVTCIGCIWEDNATYCIDINTAGLSAPYYPVLNVIGGRMYNSGLGGSVAISAVLWNQINIIGTESNFATFVDTTRGSGTSGPVTITGVKLAAGNVKFNGNKTVLRSADDTRTNVSAFLNSWANHAENSVYYYKDSSNIVHLGGQIQGGTIGTIAFTLPSGYLPRSISRFPTASNGTFGECYIDAGGNVYALVGSSSRFSLEGITFFAAG